MMVSFVPHVARAEVRALKEDMSKRFISCQEMLSMPFFYFHVQLLILLLVGEQLSRRIYLFSKYVTEGLAVVFPQFQE